MNHTTNPQDDLFVPPAAEGLPIAALDSATVGADRLDVRALTPIGRNFLAHALVQLARDGWLRAEPGEGFEPVRDRETPEAAVSSSAVVSADRATLRDRIRRAVCEAEGFGWDTDMLEPDEYGEVADAVLAVLPEQADQAEWDALCRETGRIRKASAEMVDRAERIEADVRQVRADRATLLRAADWFDSGGRSVQRLFGHQAAAELRRMADDGPSRMAAEQPTETQAQREPDPDCERCDGSGLDPDAYFVDRERQIWTHAPCSECLPEDDAPEPVERVKHSGPDTKFCVLCLSGEHERVDDAERPAVGERPDTQTPEADRG